MGHVSRRYLKEKWDSAKRDIESFLEIDNEELPDAVDVKDVEKCFYNVKEKLTAVLTELEKYKF